MNMSNVYIYNYIYTIYMKVTAPPQPQPLFLSGTVFQMGQKNFTPRRSSLRRHPSSERSGVAASDGLRRGLPPRTTWDVDNVQQRYNVDTMGKFMYNRLYYGK